MEWKNILHDLKWIESDEVQSNSDMKNSLEKKVLSMFVALLIQKTLTDEEIHEYTWEGTAKDVAVQQGLDYTSDQPKYDILTLASAYGLIPNEDSEA